MPNGRKSHIFSKIMLEIIGNYGLQHLHYFAVVATSLVIRECTEEEKKKIPTAGVVFMPKNPIIYFLYNTEFTDGMTENQLRFLFFHEILHIILMSKMRAYLHNHDQMLMNITHDMVINSTILENYKDVSDAPSENMLQIPKNYKGLRNYESLIQDLQDQVNKAGGMKKWLEKQGVKPLEGEAGQDGDGNLTGQTFDVHADPQELDEVQSEGLNRLEQTVNRGLETSNMRETIEGLVPKPRINVVDYVAKYTKAMKGNIKKGTWHRRNRKFPGYIKGKKKESIFFYLIVDVSGSMQTSDILQLLGAIMRNGIVFKLIQIDTEIKGMKLVKNQRDLKAAFSERLGCGGTTIQPALDYCREFVDDRDAGVVLIGDGYSEALKFHTPGLMVTVGQETPLTPDSAPVKQIKFEPK